MSTCNMCGDTQPPKLEGSVWAAGQSERSGLKETVPYEFVINMFSANLSTATVSNPTPKRKQAYGNLYNKPHLNDPITCIS